MGIPEGSRNANDLLNGSLDGDDYEGEEETHFMTQGAQILQIEVGKKAS